MSHTHVPTLDMFYYDGDLMGKYYTVIGNAIYIYSTGSSELLDISTLPKELGLFTEQVQWKLSPWIAMSHTTTGQSIKQAEEILV